MAKSRETISLVDEQGNEHTFDVVDIIEVAERRYAILQPAEGEEAEAVIFRVEDDETLVTVEDEEEFERVAAALEDVEGYDAVEVGAGAGEDDEDEDEESEAEDDDGADGRRGE